MDATRREFRLSAERQCKVRGSGSPSREEAGKRGTCRLQGGTYPRSIYREGRDGDRRQEKKEESQTDEDIMPSFSLVQG